MSEKLDTKAIADHYQTIIATGESSREIKYGLVKKCFIRKPE